MATLELKIDRFPRFAFLLLAIIVELMFVPLLSSSEFGLDVAQVMTAVVLVAALSATGVTLAPVLLFVPAALLHLITVYRGGPTLDVGALALRIVFFSYTTGLILWRTLNRPDVTMDTIAGAACVYTLLALVWANLYLLIEVLHPGSFVIPAHWRPAPSGSPATALVYFSFITLTTVAYGDIHPAWAGVGGFVAAEAVVGQLYLAITIARLVGLHIARRP